ncbi:MAG TPA: glycosyltransferase [Vicinamibacterales bacterium]|nr:glycosyltransferase [Vicinamibacterales bacterium]
MRVLWLSAGLLLPLDKGGKLRTFHLMRHLARRHDFVWLSYAEPDQPAADLDGMSQVAVEVHTIPRRSIGKNSVRFKAAAAAHVLRPLPYAVGSYVSAEYRRRVESLLASGRFDLVVGDFLPPVANLPERLACPAVLFTHNVEAEIWRRHAETAASTPKRWLLAQQWRRMLRFERAAVRRFDRVLAVSEADRQTLLRLYAPLPPVDVVPTGVDTAYFAPMDAPTAPGRLVFTGSMDWLPNEDAMLHFTRSVLPLIRERVPSVSLSIVGRAPTAAVRRLAQEAGIEVTGGVPDVRPHIAAAQVYVVPLRVGGGTRLKIFEAMAMGKAIVSTSIGAEGLPVRAGEHLYLADAPEDFAAAVVRLLEDVNERRRLGACARALVVERYDWAAAAQELERSLVAAAGIGAPEDETLRAVGAP